MIVPLFPIGASNGRLRLAGLSWAMLLVLVTGCSGEGSPDRETHDDPTGGRIVGTVFDRMTGEPLRDTLVSTDPPTEEVATRADGTFDLLVESGEYAVFARHIAYRAAQARTSVSGGATARVEFGLDTSEAGLVARPAMLQFGQGEVRDTFLLTSTVPDTGFSVTVTEPWMTVVPDGGVIVDGENLVLTVTIDEAALPAGERIDGQILLNTSNGTGNLVMPVLVDRAGAAVVGGETVVLANGQIDCRRVDLFRTGYSDPSLALVQFPASPTLPAEAGRRGFRIPQGNRSLVDSVIVTELGFLSIAHVSGGPESSTLSLVELSTDEEIVILAQDGVGGGGRASIDYAVPPGVYCYILGPSAGFFTEEVDVMLELGWRAEQ